MHSTVTTNCTTCVNRERPILIVGSRRFNNEVLANFIQTKTPAQCNIAENLREATVCDELLHAPWRLVLIDCHGLTDKCTLDLMQTECHLLQNNIVALFNLAQTNPLLLDLLRAGVRGFFFEKDPSEFILKGICVLKRGELWVNRETMMGYIIQQPKDRGPENHAGPPLTRREKDILSLLASGANNETIASSLYISSHTVKTHLYNILKKIGVQNRLQAALWAAKNLK